MVNGLGRGKNENGGGGRQHEWKERTTQKVYVSLHASCRQGAMATADGGSVVLSRRLHPVERLSLQGFRPELANFLGKGALLRFTGNACTAPVITSVLRQLVLPLAHPGVLGALTVPRPLNLWQPNEEALGYLAKVTRLNLHRASIGVLERLLFLEAMRQQ